MLEVVFMVGMYQTSAMYQKSVGIPLAEGATTAPRWPPATRGGGGSQPVEITGHLALDIPCNQK